MARRIIPLGSMSDGGHVTPGSASASSCLTPSAYTYSPDVPILLRAEREELERELKDLESQADLLQQQKNYPLLLESLERGLQIRSRVHGPEAEATLSAAHDICDLCNFMATSMLQTGKCKGKTILDLLHRSQALSRRNEVDLAVTYNNLACYYRRVGKLRTALRYLEKALFIEERSPHCEAAQTHLNVCATLSQLSRHEVALYHAQCAVIKLYETLRPHFSSTPIDSSNADDPPTQTTKLTVVDFKEHVAILCVAYHNLAVEHEHLKNYVLALNAYREGLRWASDHLGSSQQIHGILSDSLAAVQRVVLREQQERLRGRPSARRSTSRPASACGEVRNTQKLRPYMKNTAASYTPNARNGHTRSRPTTAGPH